MKEDPIQSVVSSEILSLLEENISGERSKEHVVQITQFDRIQASQGWYDAALYIQKILEEAGFQNALIERFSSDGEIRYDTWTPPMGWSAEHGELWMVEPTKKKLADFQEVATSLVKGSKTADIMAEVIWVGDGEDEKDYSEKKVKGKIVLAEGYAGKVHREAVLKRGAAGVVTFLGGKNRLEYPDLVPYQGLWLKKKENKKATFGFTISRREAESILSLIDKGERVKFHARVKGVNYGSEIGVMSAAIPGKKSQEEVLLLAHLDHYKPGANDNASGSAAILEIACTLKRLIDRGKLPQPKRTLRFLWVSEWYGTVPWLKNNEALLKKTIAGINFDMVGGDLVKTNSYFYFTRTPDSLPSFINDLIENVTDYVARKEIRAPTGSRYPFHYRDCRYKGGSDHWILCDAGVGVPAVMLGHPDPFHHAAQDSPDRIDPSEMKRVSIIGGASASFIAWCREADLLNLAHLVFSRGMGRMAADAAPMIEKEKDKRGKDKAKKKEKGKGRGKINKLLHSIEREKKALESVARLSNLSKTKNEIQSLIDQCSALSDSFMGLLLHSLKAHGVKLEDLKDRPRSRKELQAAKLIPCRTKLFSTPLAPGYLREVFGGDEEFKALKVSPESDIGWEICNFADGQRNLLEISDAISAEYHPVSVDDVKSMLSLLEAASLISFKKK
jgi:hypothetical protein